MPFYVIMLKLNNSTHFGYHSVWLDEEIAKRYCLKLNQTHPDTSYIVRSLVPEKDTVDFDKKRIVKFYGSSWLVVQ